MLAERELVMTWPEDIYERAAYRAPLGRELHRPDTRVIERPGWYQVITPSAAGHLNEVYISRLAPGDGTRRSTRSWPTTHRARVARR